MAYGEFRDGFDKDKYDRRFVYYGIRYIIENYVNRQWTMRDVDCVAKFYSTHNAPMFSDYPFPKELFEKFVRVCDTCACDLPAQYFNQAKSCWIDRLFRLQIVGKQRLLPCTNRIFTRRYSV